MSNRIETKKIGIISDTHYGKQGRIGIPNWVQEAFHGTNLILHAGDLEDSDVLEQLAQIAPVYAVQGNMDSSDFRLPKFRRISVGLIEILIIHRPEDASRWIDRKVTMLVHGHTHIPEIRQEGALLIINPGSPSLPRQGHQPSVACVEINGLSINPYFKFSPNSADTYEEKQKAKKIDPT